MLIPITSPPAGQGFRDYAQTGVKIDANSDLRIDITMQLGTVTNTVSVKSDALQVETQSTQNGVVIPDTKITSVPLNGRSYIDLLKLQPGVSPYSHSQRQRHVRRRRDAGVG